MSKFRALLASSLLAATLVGGVLTIDGAAEAGKAPTTSRVGGSSWCC
jgi:hypothetical protein